MVKDNALPVYRVAVIGLGIGWHHARFLADNPLTDLVAIADEDAEKRAMAVTSWPGLAVFDNGTEMIRSIQPDIVVIASRDSDHYQHLVTAIETGCHIFCEKPLVMQAGHGIDIRDRLLASKEILIGCNLLLRAAPRFIELHHHIRQNMLGDIYAFDAAYDYGRLYKLMEGWRGQDPDYAIMLGGGIHMLDLVLWLTGQRPVRVSAAGNDFFMRKARQPGGMNGPDYVTARVTFDSGMIGTISANFGCIAPHRHRLHLYGTKGSFANSYANPEITTRGSNGPEDLILHPLTATWIPKWGLLESFITGMADGTLAEKRQQMLDEIFLAIDLAFAIEKARITGQDVVLPATRPDTDTSSSVRK